MMMWSGYGFHWLWMIGFWAVIIGLLVWAVVRLSPDGGSGQDSARRILDDRLARGELGPEEYRRLREELGRH